MNTGPQYRVTTPSNTGYSGKTLGVQFAQGMAYLDERTVPDHLERSVDEVARLFVMDWGYTVEALNPDAEKKLAGYIEAKKNAPKGRSGALIRAQKSKRNAAVRYEGDYRAGLED